MKALLTGSMTVVIVVDGLPVSTHDPLLQAEGRLSLPTPLTVDSAVAVTCSDR